MKIKSSLMFLAFPSGLKIGDMCERSMFYHANDMDNPQAITL